MKIGLIVWCALIMFVGFCVMPEMVFVCLTYFGFSIYKVLR